jgi:hypothetical protein
MPLQTGRDLHVDQVLTNYVVGRRPQGYIADQVLPIMPVSKRSNVYYIRNFKEGIQFVSNMDRMAPGAAAKEVNWTVSSNTYYAEKFGLGSYWVTEDQVNADEVLQLDQSTAEMVSDRLMISYEMRVAALFASANVATITHANTAWSNTTGSRPYDDVLQQVENFRVRTTLRPNVAILGENVAQYLRRSDQIRDLLFGDRGGIPTDDQLATLFKVDKFLVPETFVNTAGPGETQLGSGTLANVWGDTFKLLYTAPAPGRIIDTWAQGFRWTDPALGVPFAIRRLPYDAKRMRQDIDGIYYQAEKIVSSDLCTIVDSLV